MPARVSAQTVPFEHVPSAPAFQKAFDDAMKQVDWDAINKKLEQASKEFEVRAPELSAWMAQDVDRLQKQLKDEIKIAQKKWQDVDAFKDILKNRELAQRFEGFARVGGPRGYSAVLVLGDMQGGASVAENVPEAAKKALGDMKDFLPYRNYRLLDSAWVLGSNRSVTRLRGAEEQVYQLSLDPSPYLFPGGKQAGGGTLHVRLQDLNESQALASPGAARELAGATERLADAKAKLAAVQQRYANASHPDVRAAEADLKKISADYEMKYAAAGGQTTDQKAGDRSPIVDTSFNIAVGETVVVGTSRLRGDKALILLLTAVPQTTNASGSSSSKGSSSNSNSSSSSTAGTPK
jgi:hypothetical protein